MKKVFECGGPNPFQGQQGRSLIEVHQAESRNRLFKVRYGLEVKGNLTYADACKAIGQAILHDACCEGRATNEGD